jgi:Cd2+/Zn2+-exporting ATPase
LTKGELEAAEIRGDDEMLCLAAMAERYSNHPISRSICKAYAERISEDEKKRWESLSCNQVKERSGWGVQAVIDGQVVLCGNEKLIRSAGIESIYETVESGTAVHVASEGKCLGCIVLRDTLKADAADAMIKLKKYGIRKTVMLTGDSERAGKQIADALGIDEYRAKLLPGDKVDAVEDLLSEKSGKGTLVFVGDGINDAPVLARADVGVAMGGLGQDAAIEAADVVIMTDEPSKLADAVSVARKTMRIVKQNIGFALGVKAIVLVLSALGYTGMWAAVFADVGVSVIAILNSMRCGRFSSY